MSIVTIFGHKKIINFPTAFDVGLHLELNLKIFKKIIFGGARGTAKICRPSLPEAWAWHGWTNQFQSWGGS